MAFIWKRVETNWGRLTGFVQLLVLALPLSLAATASHAGPVQNGDFGTVTGLDLALFAMSGELDMNASTIGTEAAKDDVPPLGNVGLGPGTLPTTSNNSTVIWGNVLYSDDVQVPLNPQWDAITSGSDIPAPIALGAARQSVRQAATDARDLVSTPNDLFTKIDETTVINGTGGLNVINLDDPGVGIDLSGSKTLTLTGSATDVFIINTPVLELSGSSSILLGGDVLVANVLINVSTRFDVSSSATVSGFIFCADDLDTVAVECDGLDPDNDYRFHGELTGGLYAENVDIGSSALIVYGMKVSEPGTTLLLALPLLAVGLRYRRSRSGGVPVADSEGQA